MRIVSRLRSQRLPSRFLPFLLVVMPGAALVDDAATLSLTSYGRAIVTTRQ